MGFDLGCLGPGASYAWSCVSDAIALFHHLCISVSQKKKNLCISWFAQKKKPTYKLQVSKKQNV